MWTWNYEFWYWGFYLLYYLRKEYPSSFPSSILCHRSDILQFALEMLGSSYSVFLSIQMKWRYLIGSVWLVGNVSSFLSLSSSYAVNISWAWMRTSALHITLSRWWLEMRFGKFFLLSITASLWKQTILLCRIPSQAVIVNGIKLSFTHWLDSFTLSHHVNFDNYGMTKQSKYEL